MTNSANPDQLASEANWSGSALFAKAEHIQVQQEKVNNDFYFCMTGSYIAPKHQNVWNN